LEIEKASN